MVIGMALPGESRQGIHKRRGKGILRVAWDSRDAGLLIPAGEVKALLGRQLALRPAWSGGVSFERQGEVPSAFSWVQLCLCFFP